MLHTKFKPFTQKLSSTKRLVLLLIAIISCFIIFIVSMSLDDLNVLHFFLSFSSDTTLSNKLVRINVEETAAFCSADPIHNCYSAQCLLPIIVSDPSSSSESSIPKFQMNYSLIGKGCTPNLNHFVPSSSFAHASSYIDEEMKEWSRGHKNQEFTCPHRKSDRMKYFKKEKIKNEQNDPLFKFKKHTSWMFSKWYDWKGKCVSQTGGTADAGFIDQTKENNSNSINDNLILSGRHSAKDGLYRLRNVCLRPRGGFGGYFPEPFSKNDERIENFRGTQDITMVPLIAKMNPNPLRNWIHATHERAKTSLQKRKYYKLNGKRVDSLENEFVRVPHRFRLSKPASCYLDTKVMLMSIDSENPGHAFHRTGYTLRSIEAAFGKEAMLQYQQQNAKSTEKGKDASEKNQNNDEVTLAFVVTDKERRLIRDFESNLKTNKMHLFYDILGTSWFSIIGFRSEEFIENNKVDDLLGFHVENISRDLDATSNRFGFDESGDKNEMIHDDEREHNNIVCFKEIVVAHGGYLGNDKRSYGMSKENSTTFADEFTPGAQTVFHLHGQRTKRDTETLEIMDTLLRRCGSPSPSSSSSISINSLPKRRNRARTRKNAHIVLGVRSYRRRMALQPYLISFISQRFKAIFGNDATFQVLEHSSLSFSEVIERYSDADVFIALYGAALMWTLFIPPNAVVIEINSIIHNYAKVPGIDRNPISEYGGQAVMANLHHLVGSDRTKIITRRPAMFNYDLHNGFELMEGLLKSAACILDFHDDINNNNNNNNPGNFEEKTDKCINKKDDDKDLRECCEISEVRNDQLILESSVASANWLPHYAPMIINTRLFSVETRGEHQLFSSSSSSSFYSSSYSSFLYSPRLEAFLSQPPKFPILNHFWTLINSLEKPTKDRSIKLLFIEPCRTRIQLLAEMSALRQTVLRGVDFSVAEFALGKERCEKMYREQNKNNKNNNTFLSKRNTGNNNNDNRSAFYQFQPTFFGDPSLNLEQASEIWNADQAKPAKTCQYPNIKDCLFGNVFMIDYVIHDCFLSSPKNSSGKTDRVEHSSHIHDRHCRVSLASSSDSSFPMQSLSATNIFNTLALARLESVPHAVTTSLRMMSFGQDCYWSPSSFSSHRFKLFSTELHQKIFVKNKQQKKQQQEEQSNTNDGNNEIVDRDDTGDNIRLTVEMMTTATSSVTAAPEKKLERIEVKELEAGTHTKIWRF